MVDYNENKPEDTPPSVIDPYEEICNQVLEEWERGREYVSDLDDLYEDIYRMIRGERPEKNYDWQSNVVINKVFQVVWTAIPYITSKVFGATPVMGIRSFEKDGAWEREQLLEFWHTLQSGGSSKHISFFLVMTQWLLRALLNGVGVLKKSWHQELRTTTVSSQQVDVPMEMDEAGNVIRAEPYAKKKKVSVPVEDFPYNLVVNNKDIVFDWLLQPSQSIRQGRFITHRSITDLDELYSSKIKYMNLDDIDPTLSTAAADIHIDHSITRTIDDQEVPPDSDVYSEVELYERQGKFPVYKKKVAGDWVPCFDKEIMQSDKIVYQEMIATVAKSTGAKTNNVLIRFDKNPYGEKTYIDLHIYLDSERWQSIGFVEPIKDIQTAINDNINAMFDEIWANLMPPVIVNKFALWDWDTMQYAPQQKWLVGGPPAESIHFKEPSNVTRDAWQKHQLLDGEIQKTAVSDSMQGSGKEKTATTNVMNANLTAAKLDFIVKMVEVTALVPSSQMDIRFAKKFAHPLTLQHIIGKPFVFGGYEEIYKYLPAAASVKMEHQKKIETQEDISLMQIVASIPNPNAPKIMNALWKNILRNRDMTDEAAMFDEDYFEPQGAAGEIQMMNRASTGSASNEQGIPQSSQEQAVRQGQFPALVK